MIADTKCGIIVAVRESFGNCPQYIHIRDVERRADALAQPTERLDGLDAAARKAIADAIALAQTHRFASWLLRCLAKAASLALDAGDLDGWMDGALAVEQIRLLTYLALASGCPSSRSRIGLTA